MRSADLPIFAIGLLIIGSACLEAGPAMAGVYGLLIAVLFTILIWNCVGWFGRWLKPKTRSWWDVWEDPVDQSHTLCRAGGAHYGGIRSKLVYRFEIWAINEDEHWEKAKREYGKLLGFE